MTPATIIREAQADGVMLGLSSAGTIKATGDGATVNRWLATIRAHKAGILEALKAGVNAQASTSRWWLIHYRDREPVEIACCPDATHAEVLERHPDAIAAEPLTPAMRRPAAPLTANEEESIRAWLALIDETDQATLDDVLERCQSDADARDYYSGRAAERKRSGGG